MTSVRRCHRFRNRLVAAAVVATALAPQLILQPSASGSASPSGLAWSAKVAVEESSVRTLAVRNSMNVAYQWAHHSHLKVVLMHNMVIRTTATLRVAPVGARPAIQKALTYQTAVWLAWVRLYNQRNASYLTFVRLNAATEADFRAKSANALSTAHAVPSSPPCPPANPYVGAAQYRVMSHPGMSIRRYAKPGRTVLWVTTADLKAPGAKTSVGPLTAPYLASRTQLAQVLTGSGALAGVNGDFYYLGHDNSPWGAVVKRNGGIVKSTTDIGQKTFMVAANGLAKIDFVDVLPVLHQGRYSVRANSLNSHSLPINGIAIFTPQWGPASRGDLKPRQAVREYVADYRGVITAIRARMSNVPIPRRGLVIVAQGSAIQRLNVAGFRLGKRVSQTSSATSSAGQKVYSAIGVGRQLLRNGQFSFLSCTLTGLWPARPLVSSPADARSCWSQREARRTQRHTVSAG